MKKLNLNDVDVRAILEMHQKEGYKSSLLNEQGTQAASVYQAYQQMVDPSAAAVKAGMDQLQKQQQTKQPGKQNFYVTQQKNCVDQYRCIPKGTKFVSFNEKRVIAYNVTLNKQESPVNVSYYCASNELTLDYKAGVSKVTNETLTKTLSKVVCGTPKYVAQQVKDLPAVTVTAKKPDTTQKPIVGAGGKPKTFKLKPTEEQQCQLLGDKVWSYAKKGNQWFASKDKTNWFDVTNNKVAVDKLVAGCKNIKELVAFTPPPAAEYEGPSPEEVNVAQSGETLVSGNQGV